MALLGNDGNGFELARKLETCGVWRSWLGDSLYSKFIPFLSTPSVWESFMTTTTSTSDDSKSTRALLHLQLRARALLFDKSCLSLSSSVAAVSKLNPSYLQLHGDDVYFTLEIDGPSQRDAGSILYNSNKIQSKPSFKAGGSRYVDSEMDTLSQRFGHDDLPETWYNQFIEKYRASNPYRLVFNDHELEKRTPEEMSVYIKLRENHKRRRLAFEEDHKSIGNEKKSNSFENDQLFFPETTFKLNCLPDSALLPAIKWEEKTSVKFCGVLDTLAQVTTKGAVMIERLGLRSENLTTGQGISQYQGTNGSERYKMCLSSEQASQLSIKVIARMLPTVGFDGGTEVTMDVCSQLLSCHIGKLGRALKILADSYRKQCSANELIKMFLQSTGHSNFRAIVELVRDGTRNTVKKAQHVQGMQTPLQAQFQNPLRQPQQIPRQMHSQMQQMALPPNLNFQQQQHQWSMRRRQSPSPSPAIDLDKDRPLVQVKLENPTEMPMDSSPFTNMNARNTQMQLRQQQVAAMSNQHAQSGNQFRQMASVQVPQPQTPSMISARAPPVKVEGFQELMGGDSALKHDSDGNKLTSPSK